MKHFIFIFLDGVGIGAKSETNPFYCSNLDYLPLYGKNNLSLPDNTPIKPIDPLLGVKGIPQSATGQTSLFLGENIPGLLGQHRGSYPNKFMRQKIRNDNLLKSLKDKGYRIRFINAYPCFAKFFSADHIRILEDGKLHFSPMFPEFFKNRISVTTAMMISAGLIPSDESDIKNQLSIYQEFTNNDLINQGLELPRFSPEQAAGIVFDSSKNNDFILYEYFQTDFYGHRKSLEECKQLVSVLDRFFKKLISLLDPDQYTLLVTSDHGNLEDLSHKKHTLNPVPLIVWGKNSNKLRKSINNIAQVTPAISSYFK